MSGTAPLAGSGAMFDGIATKYDSLNRILSLGADLRWRRRMIDRLVLTPRARMLDVATGTGDVALLALARHPEVLVEGIDPSEAMLAIARKKADEAAVSSRLMLRAGTAEKLPFADASFDAATIAFGIRNVPDRPAGLREMRRVVRPGGRIAILELTEPPGLLGVAARFHVHRVVPRIGALLSGAREYRYLASSIAAFPPPDRFVTMMEEAGIESLSRESFAFGAATLFVGGVP